MKKSSAHHTPLDRILPVAKVPVLYVRGAVWTSGGGDRVGALGGRAENRTTTWKNQPSRPLPPNLPFFPAGDAAAILATPIPQGTVFCFFFFFFFFFDSELEGGRRSNTGMAIFPGPGADYAELREIRCLCRTNRWLHRSHPQDRQPRPRTTICINS